MKRKKYLSTEIGRKLIIMVVLHAGKLGLESTSTMMALFLAAYMADLGIAGYWQILNWTPCATTLCEFVFEGAVDSILLEQDKMQSASLTILCNKGDSRKIQEGANFVKLVGQFKEREGVNITCISISSTGSNSVSASQNISFSLQLYDTLSHWIFWQPRYRCRRKRNTGGYG